MLQRLWWAIEEQNPERISKCEKAYFSTVEDWNARFWRNRNKIRLLVGEEPANNFLDYSDDRAGDNPQSLHYEFVVAHRKVMAAKGDFGLADDARRHMTALNFACSVFLERITSLFLERTSALQLLEIPVGPGAAEQAAAKDAQRVHR